MMMEHRFIGDDNEYYNCDDIVSYSSIVIYYTSYMPCNIYQNYYPSLNSVYAV